MAVIQRRLVRTFCVFLMACWVFMPACSSSDDNTGAAAEAWKCCDDGLSQCGCTTGDSSLVCDGVNDYPVKTCPTPYDNCCVLWTVGAGKLCTCGIDAFSSCAEKAGASGQQVSFCPG